EYAGEVPALETCRSSYGRVLGDSAGIKPGPSEKSNEVRVYLVPVFLPDQGSPEGNLARCPRCEIRGVFKAARSEGGDNEERGKEVRTRDLERDDRTGDRSGDTIHSRPGNDGATERKPGYPVSKG